MKIAGNLTLEKHLDNCVLTKDKVDKFSRIVTSLVVFALILMIYLEIIKITNYLVILILSLILIIKTLWKFYTKVINSNDRIYSEFPSKFGLFVSVPFAYYMILFITRDVTLSNNDMMQYSLLFLFIVLASWMSIYLIHTTIVEFIAGHVFVNPDINFSSRVHHLGTEGSQYSEYYLYFYSPFNELLKYRIYDYQFNNWKKGDPIDTVLRVNLDRVDVVSVRIIHNSDAKIDLDEFIVKHQQDVEQFGEAQERVYPSKFFYFDLFTFPLVIIYVFIGNLACDIFEETAIMSIVIAISLILTVAITLKEYKDFKIKCTLEEIALWKDFIVPRTLFYFFCIGMTILIIPSIVYHFI